MKHFITAISLQARELSKVIYSNIENAEYLDNNQAFTHPILVPLKNLAKGEKIRVTAIVTDNEACHRNFDTFSKELESLSAEMGFEYGAIETIDIPYAESSSKHLYCFERIIDSIGENDEIAADLTYGNKPTSIAIQLALTFSYLFGKNTVVKVLTYGELDFSTKPVEGEPRRGFIYDVSALFYMNSIMAEMTSAKPQDPLGFIKMLLGNGGKDNGEN